MAHCRLDYIKVQNGSKYTGNISSECEKRKVSWAEIWCIVLKVKKKHQLQHENGYLTLTTLNSLYCLYFIMNIFVLSVLRVKQLWQIHMIKMINLINEFPCLTMQNGMRFYFQKPFLQVRLNTCIGQSIGTTSSRFHCNNSLLAIIVVCIEIYCYNLAQVHNV